MSGDADLAALAAAADLQVDWTDAQGRPQQVEPPVLRALLAKLELPAETPAQLADSLARARAERHDTGSLPPLLTAEQAHPVALPWRAPGDAAVPWRLELASGATAAGLAERTAGGLALAPIDEPGLHRLLIGDASVQLAVAPARCFGVGDALAAQSLHGRSLPWGVSVQVYSLRQGAEAATDSAAPHATQHAGLGDFSLLAACAVAAARQGASAMAINPMHAPFGADARRYSPYAPSSRQFLNPLYVDPAATFGEAAVHAAIEALVLGPALARLDALPLIDWPAVGHARMRLLRHLFDQRAALLQAAQLADFDAFRAAGGTPLENHARFEALHAQHAVHDPGQPWWQWPADEHGPDAGGAARIAAAEPETVGFHVFTQWLAARGLAGAHAAARGAGMPIGLVGDLAVGADPAGSHAWSRQGEILRGVGVGAPPDVYNLQGQGWGLCAFSPRGLRASGYQAFTDLLHATMGPVGGIRIDHVLGLGRLWLIPDGAPPSQGCYLRYPFDDLMRLIRLTSWQRRAVVIGENLGTVPAGFNDQLAAAGLLGIAVLPFERQWLHGQHAPLAPGFCFRAPEAWSAEQIATTTTHDMPPLAGWWRGVDIDARQRLGLVDETQAGHEHGGRHDERRALLYTLADAATRSPAIAAAHAPHGEAAGDPAAADAPAPLDGSIALVGRTPAALAMVPIEDLLGLADQINLPGTTDEHPNWRHRLPDAPEPLFERPAVQRRARALAAARAEAARPALPPADALPT